MCCPAAGSGHDVGAVAETGAPTPQTHQNKFHGKALAELALKFKSIDVSNVSAEDREMWEYFATLYKNSNKGIKGRGKNRRVQVSAGSSPISPQSAESAHVVVPSPPMAQPSPPLPQQQQQQMQGALLPGMAPYAVIHHHRSGPPPPPQPATMMMHLAPRAPRPAYDMYDGSYEDEHGRAELAFGDRMY